MAGTIQPWRERYADEVVAAEEAVAGAGMLAIAHSLKDPRSNFAETAFLVRDDLHGKGIGTELMLRIPFTKAA